MDFFQAMQYLGVDQRSTHSLTTAALQGQPVDPQAIQAVVVAIATRLEALERQGSTRP
jgi:hypothetical protein